MKLFIRHITILLFLALPVMTGCKDGLTKERGVGEGMATITATVDFKPMPSALSRAPGKVLDNISYLYLLLYDAQTKELKKKIPIVTSDYTVAGFELSDKERDTEGGKWAETTTKQAKFTLWDKIEFGSYYMYAVANIKDLIYDIKYDTAIKTVDGLKNIILSWNKNDITQNGEMIGHFTSALSTTDGEEIPLEINRENVDIHAWLRRAASKVTVEYDGSNLKDGVNIYVRSVSIKDIPRTCLLGNSNTPASSDELINDGETIEYCDDVFSDVATFKSEYPCKVNNTPDSWHGSDHSETSEALYFYENMQGDNGPDKRQDADGDGIIDDQELKDGVPCGTYIEVSAIYSYDTAVGSETGAIKYRFMLGMNTTNNYNAERNHHYKLKLKFNGTAKDIDWHIDYQEQILEVTPPKVMNYLGTVFVPEYLPGTVDYNYGHNFDYNTVSVSSYIEDKGELLQWKMAFSYDGKPFTEDKPDWLDYEITDGSLPYIKNVKFKVITPNKTECLIDSLLKDEPSKSEVKDLPYNLANPDEGAISPNNASIQNTANCYIVDGPGWYLLPLVYGNAIKGGKTNEEAYFNGSGQLSRFKDHKGKEITSPYIKTSYTPQSAFLVWEDENKLIEYEVWKNTWAPDIEYLPQAYGGIGGIRFYINKDNIQQGNALIGLSDKILSGDDLSSPNEEHPETGPDNFPDMMWSWHIWVTNFSFLESEDETIEVTGHDESKKYQLMPVNLGWCSGHNDTVKYYKARKCDVKFYVEGIGNEVVITLEQKSHIAVTRGTSPYFQWGRKDPFVGATGNNINKPRFISKDWLPAYVANPARLFDNTADLERWTTREAIDAGLLIRKPHLWHNPKRTENEPALTGDEYDYRSLNATYTNLWRQPDGAKTVYDPCPVGYQVPSVEAFSGFTTTGKNTSTSFEWYDVRYENIAEYNAETGMCGYQGNYSKGLYEFYTNPDKVQSIVIPESGYRDWDDDASAYKVDIECPIGYLWSSTYETNEKGNHKDVCNFEFARKDEDALSYIRPKNKFYSCDGFPIRPVKTPSVK